MKTAKQWFNELVRPACGDCPVDVGDIQKIQADALNHAAEIAGSTASDDGLSSECGHYNRGCFDVEDKLKAEAAKLITK